MKLISEEVSSEYLVEEDKKRKNTRLKVFFYSLISKIEMDKCILKKS